MSERILVGTRKGTFIVEKSGGRWRPALAGHAGVGVNYVARDPSTGALWSLLGHGHWGAKVSRSRDGGKTWEDAAQVKYPDGARYIGMDFDEQGNPKEGAVRPATLLLLWVIGFGPGGRVYVGTIPGGLFVSQDGGESWARIDDGSYHAATSIFPAKDRLVVNPHSGDLYSLPRSQGFTPLLYRSYDGDNWIPVTNNGMSNPWNIGLRTLVSTPHGMFIGTANPFGPKIMPLDGQYYVDNPRGGCEVFFARTH